MVPIHGVGGSNPSEGTIHCWGVAQLAERLTLDQKAVGSSPTSPAIFAGQAMVANWTPNP